MSLRLINIDTEDLKKQLKGIGLEIEKRINEELVLLAKSTHGRIVERAQEELHSNRKAYQDALKFDFTSEPGTYVIYLEKEADWIEDGLPENFDMKPGLLQGKSSHQAKDGHRYAIVPFNFSKGPKNLDKKSRDLLADVKKALRAAKMKMGAAGIVNDADGKPKIGHIASIEVKNSANLKGLRVYQQIRKDKHGKNFVNQEIMTFRTVTDRQGNDMWRHPGGEGKHFFDEAYQWALNELENNIIPKIKQEFGGP